MAKMSEIYAHNEFGAVLEGLRRSVQSANINFFIGSGCGDPAIPPLGNIENEIQKLNAKSMFHDSERKMFEFLQPFIESTAQMEDSNPSDSVKRTVELHRRFLEAVSLILIERKSNILAKQATIFSTNYDLFTENAFESLDTQVRLNDGFRRSPNLTGSFKFSSSEFFNTTYNNGTVYNYRVELPSINLVKLHGSLNWCASKNGIQFTFNRFGEMLKNYKKIAETKLIDEIEIFNKQFSIILPTKQKLEDTILNQTYYDLLRIYANALDKENTILLVVGFSFADEHLLEITRRALKNPTLKLVVFSHSGDDAAGFKEKFNLFNNVEILFSKTGELGFDNFIDLLAELPHANYPSSKVGGAL